ncbi:MAG TPA: hypothetical protein V6C72_12445, partial [Chroococcales cyanobacterium]
PIGCRRFNPLNIQSGEQGCIYFKQTKDIQNCSCSVANAIVRLLLDIGLQSAMLSAAIVPSGIFSQTVDNFGVFKFYPYNISPETGLAATMHVHLTAQPSGQDQSVYYFGN